MIHTSITQNCTVFILRRELTRSAIGSKKCDSHGRRGKRKTVQFRGMFVWTIVFYFYNIFLTIMHFTTNGFNCFLKTNSADPRQRVPLKVQ